MVDLTPFDPPKGTPSPFILKSRTFLQNYMHSPIISLSIEYFHQRVTKNAMNIHRCEKEAEQDPSKSNKSPNFVWET